MNKLLNSITIFSSSMSTIDWIWRLVTIFIIGSSGTATGLIASNTPLLKDLGLLVWIAVGILSALLIAVIFFLIKLSDAKSAEAEYTRAVSQPKSYVNPLKESFTDQVIPIEDLRLPGQQVHEHKHFKRCSFVGPGAIALMGGNYVNTGFFDTGDLIPLPDNTYMTGIIVLVNCTVEECRFYRTTLMVRSDQAQAMANAVAGLRIAGQDS